jgi:uncharacterized protein YbjT (DUF2867 family)
MPSENLLQQLSKEKGFKWTILRPGYFLENTGDALKAIKNGSDKFVYGDVHVPPLTTVDIGRSGAACLAASDVNEHDKKFYELTGPAYLTASDMAKAISKKLNREIKFEAYPVENFAYWPAALQQVAKYCVKNGKDAMPQTDDVLRLTGRNVTFEEFLESQL